MASKTSQVLVTGGTGFVGSHTAVELILAGRDVVIVDDLSNSSEKVIGRIKKITGLPEDSTRIFFHKVSLLDKDALDKVFAAHPNIDSVIHFAGLKAVGESVKKPLYYYDVNLNSSLNLLNAMDKYNVTTLLFSSTATVYGEPEKMPITEDFAIAPKSPYASTKMMIEYFLQDLYRTNPERWHIGILRYFNPCGAHESGLLGEDPCGIPQNLMPVLARVATGKLDKVTVFGNDYPTRDGTAVRDYIHVVDIAKGHNSAFDVLAQKPQCFVYNLSTGTGTTVLEMINAFTKACGKEVPYVLGPRRPGDVPVLVADPAAASRDIGWKITYDIERMCADFWRWATLNPEGYNTQN